MLRTSESHPELLTGGVSVCPGAAVVDPPVAEALGSRGGALVEPRRPRTRWRETMDRDLLPHNLPGGCPLGGFLKHIGGASSESERVAGDWQVSGGQGYSIVSIFRDLLILPPFTALAENSQEPNSSLVSPVKTTPQWSLGTVLV